MGFHKRLAMQKPEMPSGCRTAFIFLNKRHTKTYRDQQARPPDLTWDYLTTLLTVFLECHHKWAKMQQLTILCMHMKYKLLERIIWEVGRSQTSPLSIPEKLQRKFLHFPTSVHPYSKHCVPKLLKTPMKQKSKQNVVYSIVMVFQVGSLGKYIPKVPQIFHFLKYILPIYTFNRKQLKIYPY